MASETYCQIAFQRRGTNSQCHHSVVGFPDGQPGLGVLPLTAGEDGCVCVCVCVCAHLGSCVHGLCICKTFGFVCALI